MMGGGIQDEFLGGVVFQAAAVVAVRSADRSPETRLLRQHHRRGEWSSRLPERTRNGITVKRSMQFKDAAGNVQQAFDTLMTNSVNTQTEISGTLTFDRAADSLSGDDRRWQSRTGGRPRRARVGPRPG